MNSLLRSLLLKLNITVLRGNPRKALLESKAPELPEHLLENSKVVASREAVLKYLPKGGTAVEVGVAYGEFSDKIIATLQPEKFIAIDAFGKLPIQANEGDKPLDDLNASEHYRFYKNKFKNEIESGKVRMIRGYSWDGINELPDASVDYFYIDADHSYNSVVKDIAAAKKKLKPGGLIQFNDYTCVDIYDLQAYGVYKAVNEFLIAENFEIIYLCLEKYGFHDLVVRKKI